jgi:hypothetical protein
MVEIKRLYFNGISLRSLHFYSAEPRGFVEHYLTNTVFIRYGKQNVNLLQQDSRFPLPLLQYETTPTGTLP